MRLSEHERLEARARLALRRHRAVELTPSVVPPPDECQDLSGRGSGDDDRALERPLGDLPRDGRVVPFEALQAVVQHAVRLDLEERVDRRVDVEPLGA